MVALALFLEHRHSFVSTQVRAAKYLPQLFVLSAFRDRHNMARSVAVRCITMHRARDENDL